MLTASLVDRFKDSLASFPHWLAVMMISALPVFELRGGIPAGVALGMPLWQAVTLAVIANMLPIPFILLLLGPLSGWLSRHSKLMKRFFDWLFARTRRKHSKSFERWQEIALMIFVGIPLPMTGAWSGALAAFVFGIPFWPAMLFIFLGVLIAAAVVTLATSFSFLIGWQGSLVCFALLTGVLVYIFMRGRKEYAKEFGEGHDTASVDHPPAVFSEETAVEEPERK
ncbi:MAG: small multi-drug export protein [Actinomycetota bacterium]